MKEEATRLLTVYLEHKDSDDPLLRRKAHVELDRFLMQHREEITALAIEAMEAKRRKKRWSLSFTR